MAISTCATCPFWVAKNYTHANQTAIPEDFGECRINPPVAGGLNIFMSGAPKNVAAIAFPFPMSHYMDFCGQHPELYLQRPAHRSAQSAFASEEQGDELTGEGRQK